MFTAEAERGPVRWRTEAPALLPPGCLWSVRLAGPNSACPALEIYEAGELVDVVSSTQLAVPLLRGARAVRRATGDQAVAWGRLQLAGPDPEAEFSRGLFSRQFRTATVIKLTAWCWIAIAPGRLDRVTVRCGGQRIHRRLMRG
jgi:hypothetical protein